jgi:hypothetical protein
MCLGVYVDVLSWASTGMRLGVYVDVLGHRMDVLGRLRGCCPGENSQLVSLQCLFGVFPICLARCYNLDLSSLVV